MIDETYNRIWALSKAVDNPVVYQELTRLTESLLHVFDEQGRLDRNPFESARHRLISLPRKIINEELKGSVCLVTGGLGCVGSVLISQLLKFDVKHIVIVDKNPCERYKTSKMVTSIVCDIRNEILLNRIFAEYQPDIVFHTAAQRDPGYAEMNVEETVNTNVIGTLNVVRASEATPTVRQVVAASTGKASRYFTKEIYASTKKISEFLIDAYARSSKIKYALVRFTHILDNSLMDIALKNSAYHSSCVPVHSPGKYVTAQNAREAAHLMLNALIENEQGQCNLLLVRHLEWPVESLSVALYYIKQSGRKIPVTFVGNPMGYSEKFFRGQFDWSKPEDLNLLINVYERGSRRLNKAGDIVITHPCSTSTQQLTAVLQSLHRTRGEESVTSALHVGLQELVRCSLQAVDINDTLDILNWGLDPHFLQLEKTTINDFGLIVPLLIESLAYHSMHSTAETSSNQYSSRYATSH